VRWIADLLSHTRIHYDVAERWATGEGSRVTSCRIVLAWLRSGSARRRLRAGDRTARAEWTDRMLILW
jgi:hypothetical protein